MSLVLLMGSFDISIHALLAESDFLPFLWHAK